MNNTWNEALIVEQIQNILYKSFNINLANEPGAMHIGDLGLDSMGILDVIMSIEDIIGQKISEIDLPKNPTVSDVAKMVINNIKATNND